MLELAADLLPRLADGESVAVVTVTRVARSAPRGLGASMAITADGSVIGSISGGCVEGDAIVLAHAVLADGAARAARFGFSDERAHAAGLACGGEVEVLAYVLRPDDDVARHALEAAARDERVTVALGIRAPHEGVVADASGLSRIAAEALPELDAAALLAETTPIADHAWLSVSQAPRARLIVVGAGEHAAALCRVASAAGYAVTVCDPWPLLATSERFPDASDIVIADPGEYLTSLAEQAGSIDARTAVCVLSHDERIDIPALYAALGMNVGFVGAMGARSTVEQRGIALRERGVTDADLARLHSPLGLDLGGSSPEEAAVAAIAEIIAARYGRSGGPLRDARGPVHARPPASPASPAPTCSPV
ncbi:Xanthine and CO dehydrogenase maturation factor,XdhC/CoxF family [Microbacterium sp. C448]|uniref:XdhC family protein n=1 Tax=Microbacterium sp. C448 TaxID=1177594 RepID=UPI0003DE3B57|nr:XdhC/CoxI family protein [Microbacterium sp. C448]CDK01336.1 Xanthine and CO dehydrogenase maturation factor,XdhC/CoxF family [Microbacterium sp. C448]